MDRSFNDNGSGYGRTIDNISFADLISQASQAAELQSQITSSADTLSTEISRAIATENQLTAFISAEAARAAVAESKLYSTITAQAATISSLQSAVSSLTGTINSYNQQFHDIQTQFSLAFAEILQNTNGLANIFDYNTGTLMCNSLKFNSSSFRLIPIRRYNLGSSGVDLALIYDDGRILGAGAQYGMYIGSDGRCFMNDNNGTHQIAVQ